MKEEKQRGGDRLNNRKKLDAVMAVLMICAMSYQATGNLFHEAAGVILLLLFIIHNVLNRKWYRSLPRGKYSRYRKGCWESTC